METTKTTTKKRGKSFFSWLLGGDILTEEFIARQSKLIILVVVLILLFISNRYSCTKKLTEIEDLNMKLKNVKYETLIISTDLTTHTRQSQIEELLKTKGIELEVSKTPAFEIQK
jgi:hypothetical protein